MFVVLINCPEINYDFFYDDDGKLELEMKKYRYSQEAQNKEGEVCFSSVQRFQKPSPQKSRAELSITEIIRPLSR